MDFLEDLFDFGNRKRQKSGGLFQNGDHHDDNHNEHHDDDHGHQNQYPTNSFPQVPTNPAAFPTGIVCRKCSTSTMPGAKFCHGCGAALEMILNCASCGSKLPTNAPFCPQCGYKNGNTA
jgi:ribosomal protein L40E